MFNFPLPGIGHYQYHPPQAPSRSLLVIKSPLPKNKETRRDVLIGLFNFVKEKF